MSVLYHFHVWVVSPLFTYWDWAMQICVSKISTIASDNSLSPGRCQAIIGTGARILSTGALGTISGEILSNIETFSFHACAMIASWHGSMTHFQLYMHCPCMSGTPQPQTNKPHRVLLFPFYVSLSQLLNGQAIPDHSIIMWRPCNGCWMDMLIFPSYYFCQKVLPENININS